MCGLSLAWVTSENSTMLLESDILRLFFTGPYLMLPRFSARCLVLTAPPFFHANFSSAACLSALQPPTVNSLSSCPTTASLGLLPPTLSAPVQLPTASLWVASSTLLLGSPYHFRIRRDFMSKNPLSGFAPKQTRLLWQPAPIMLHTRGAPVSYRKYAFAFLYMVVRVLSDIFALSQSLTPL